MRNANTSSNRTSVPLARAIGQLTLRYHHFQLISAPRSCTRDEGRPLGVGLQEQAPNRLKLHGSRALVVSVEGKDMAMTMSGEVQGDERKRTTDEVSK
jgi:hypothetical protein